MPARVAMPMACGVAAPSAIAASMRSAPDLEAGAHDRSLLRAADRAAGQQRPRGPARDERQRSKHVFSHSIDGSSGSARHIGNGLQATVAQHGRAKLAACARPRTSATRRPAAGVSLQARQLRRRSVQREVCRLAGRHACAGPVGHAVQCQRPARQHEAVMASWGTARCEPASPWPRAGRRTGRSPAAPGRRCARRSCSPPTSGSARTASRGCCPSLSITRSTQAPCSRLDAGKHALLPGRAPARRSGAPRRTARRRARPAAGSGRCGSSCATDRARVRC